MRAAGMVLSNFYKHGLFREVAGWLFSAGLLYWLGPNVWLAFTTIILGTSVLLMAGLTALLAAKQRKQARRETRT